MLSALHLRERGDTAHREQDGSIAKLSDTVSRQSLSSNTVRARVRAAKRAFTTRRVELDVVRALSTTHCAPNAGDLVLAKVIQVRQHPRIETPEGRKAQLYPGDDIVVAYGNRYAPNQFEATVPADLSTCHLVAGGGVAARMGVRHSGMKPATTIEPIGLLLDAHGQRVNLRQFGLRSAKPAHSKPTSIAPTQPDCSASRPARVLAVVGSSMDAGKTTAAGQLIRGLSAAGLRVGAAKVTGTGSGGDLWHMIDCGATSAFDFTDAGHASTYMLEPEAVERILHTLIDELVKAQSDVIVLEVVDGLYQRETEQLLRSACFRQSVDGVFLAVRDALAAAAGCEWLRAAGLPLFGVTGAINMAPLSVREAEAATGKRVLGEADLTQPDFVTQYVFDAARVRAN